MTLIAFASYGDHAEILTDTSSYTEDLERLSQTTKHLTLNHLDAAVLATGDGVFIDHVRATMLQAGALLETFDDLVDVAGGWVGEFWRHHRDGRGLDPEDRSTVCLVGYSHSDGAFRCYSLAPETEFQPQQVDGLWMNPAPWSHRPNDLELDRMTRYAREYEEISPGGVQMVTEWATKPVADKPLSIEDWVHLGSMAREQRSLGSDYGRIVIAGRLIHARLDRDTVTSRVVHTFNDNPEGEEFRELVRNTRHPRGQVQPCWCDSGMQFIDCHLAESLDDPCGCGAGKAFRACCAV